MNTKHILIIGFVFLTILGGNECYASHAMGADLTYKCLGGMQYRLRLSFYRDCSGVAAPGSVTININSASCGYTLSKTLNPIPGTGQEITPICASVNTTCTGGTYTGIREWIYEGTVTLPGACVDWDFSYGLCCRNGAISTIVTPLSEQIYIHSTLNNVITPCNNSPTFMNLPVPFACTSQQFCYNHGAYDADGDSLAYSLITPLGAGGVPVTYLPGYSASQPMNSVPPMTFNPLTGDFCATPQTVEVTVMAVLVKEYRNGVLIGQVERDMQITVRPCTNMLPNLSGINGTSSFSDTICANQPYCFNVISNDVDAGQNLTVTWDGAIPGITMTTAGAPHPVATFCWTPGTSNASLTPYIFTVKVKDDACPYLGIQIYSYSLMVANVTANAGPDQSVHCGGTVNISATGVATFGSVTYLWSNGVTTASQSVGPGSYTVTVSNGICSTTDNVNILLIPDITADFNATTVCANSPATFSDMSVAAAGSVVSWSWAFGDGTSSTLQNPSHVYSGSGPYNVCLISTNSLGCSDTVCKSVTLVAPPTAGFLVNNDCEGIPLNFMNTSTGAGLSSYSWSFGNGATSTLQNPVLTYPVAGVYPVTLIVTNALGCKDTIVQQVTAYPLPIADFNITGGGLCNGGQVSLSDVSTGTINNWSWSFGNGQTSTLQNPSLTYALPGPFNITLIVTSAKGCVDTITKPITISMVFSAPAITTQNICPGKTATVTATGGVSYLWSNGLTTAAITVSPAATNTYTVTVTDSKGCTDTVPATVTVYPAVALTISPAQSICIGQAASLTAGGASTYSWLPGGATGATISVSPAANTTYTVTGTNVNGCTATKSVNVTVNALPVVSLASPVICPASSVTLNAGNPGAGYLWSTGGTNQTINVATAGTYSVTVTNSFGCTASAQSVITASTLTANPQIFSVCNGTVATLSAANPGKTYLWSNGATSQTISVTVAGFYTVTVSDASGCNISFTSALTVNPVPVPNFTNGLTCANIPVVFSNTSSIASGSITSYNWKFGDGTISSQQNPTHQYLAAGTYSVCLKVTSNNGCVDSICKTISVHTPPNAGFTVNNGCQGKALTLTNTSSPGGLSSYQWNFGNGATSGAYSPALSYAAAGNYNVSLIVVDSYGCSDTLQSPVTAYALPVVTATAVQPICSGQSATLTSGGASTYAWLPGGATGQTISVSPAANTNYTVTGTNVNGCTATAVVNVTVYAIPVVALTSPVICPASAALLNAGNPGANYLWSTGGTYQTLAVTTAGTYSVTVTNSFGCTATAQTVITASTLTANPQSFSVCNGTAATLSAANPGKTYLWSNGATTQTISVGVAKTYTVTVTDASGCTLSFASVLTVNPVPVPNFTNGLTCANIPVVFSNTSSIASGSITTYNWKFGDGTISSQQNPTHQYLAAGTYSVCLKVTSNNGCVDSICKTISVHTPPNAGFTVNNGCQGNALTLTNTSSPAGLSSYQWNFGNGATSGAYSPALSYSSAGNYNVSLIVADSYGCSDTLLSPVTAYALPVVTATAVQPICSGQSATLTSGGASTYAWLPGGASGQTISVSPSANTNYTVTGTNINGCTATAVLNLTVYTIPVVALTSPVICPASSALLNAGNPGANYLWSTGGTYQTLSVTTAGTYSVTVTNSFGCTATGQTTITASSLTANPQNISVCNGTVATFSAGNPGNTYLWSNGFTSQTISVGVAKTYTVTVTDVSGCTLSFASTLTVNPKPVVNFTTGPICLNASTLFMNTSSVSSGSLAGCTWNFGDGTSSTQQNASHQYSAAGTYNVCLVVTTNNGCIDSIVKTITAHTPPSANFAINNGCEGNVLNLTNTSSPSGLTSYIWNFGNGGTSALQSPALTYSSPGSYNISLIVTDAVGCSDTSYNPVTIYSLPQLTIAPAQPICQGQTASLTANGSASYLWVPGSIGGASINVSPASSTNYLVTGIDTNGCAGTATVNLIVNPLPVVNLTNPVICPSSFVTLDAGNTGSSYLWSTGASNQTITTSTVGNYSVTVTNSFGCTATGQSLVTESTLAPNSQTLIVCNGTITTFNAANSGNTYSWSNGATSQSIPVSVAGAYTVTVTDVNGCTLSFASTLIVNASPAAKFSANAVCLNDTTVFNNTSSVTSGTLKSYHWDFGDGNSSTDRNPQHLYSTPGTFTAILTVVTDSGCIADTSLSVMVHPKPIATFAPPASCAGDQLIFANNSSVSTGSIASYQWNFGDNSALSALANPTHIYNNAGTYPVTLIVLSNFGCADTLSQQALIHPNPVAHFVFDTVKGCGPLTVNFTDLSNISTGSVTSWHWSFGDGSTSTVRNPSHTYTTAGTFTVTLIAKSADGCPNTYTYPNAITVYPDPVAAFTPDPVQGGTVLQIITFENQSTGAINYQWDLGDGTTTHDVSPAHNYINDGTYIVSLLATNQYGCIDKTRQEVIIVPTWTVYIPNAFSPNGDGRNDVFTLEGIGITNYNIKVFSRWGEVVFDADNRGWDGKHMKYGVACKEDVYIYKVSFNVNVGGSHDRTGQVTLMK